MCPSAGGHSDGIFWTWLLATAARKRWVEGCLADDAAAGECVFRKRSSQFAVTTPLRGCAVNRADWTMSFARRFVQAKKTGGPRYCCR